MENHRALTLVRETLHGQTNRFAELVKGFEGPVYNLALRMTGSPADAADLTQETFLRAWLNLDKYDQERKFFTWLYTLALNLIRNHLRKAARLGPTAGVLPDRPPVEEAVAANPVQALDARRQGRDIQAVLQRLPLEQREALLLRFFQDVSFEDIAVILGVGVSCAKMRVRRGLVAMRGMMPGREGQGLRDEG